MTKPISLLFGVHAHQPVGNFPEVLAEAHERCYRPFIQALYRFPEFPFAIHFSGWLLDWLFSHYPDDMAMLREMVGRGQVELFGAGDTEPVLAVIPYRDRVGQIERLSAKLDKSLGQHPHGAWLTERVWEATVVPALADCGIRYVTVDDYHFLCTGKTAEQLDGFYSTEEDGRRLDLFPISEALRYRFPFSPAHEAVAYLEAQAEQGHEAAIYFDDIEKFGIWPETYEWVYEKGWLNQFIEGVLASPRIRPQRYADYHAAARTRGVIYLPTTSYIEMNEWTLPAPRANDYADLVHASKAHGQFERNKAFLRGGIWKNFLSRYPESNWMHKRMLALSQRYADLPDYLRHPEMLDALYQAQANDAYWHGLFGGLYLPHLRRAVYNAIVALEAMLDRAAPRPPVARLDLDLDGHEEVFMQNAILQAVVRLDGTASVHELDSYPLAHNFADTLMRQPEHYYRKIHHGQSQGQVGEGIASAHDRVAFKQHITPDDLIVDARPKTLFLDSIRLSDEDTVYLRDYQLAAQSADGQLTFAEESRGYRVEKHIALADGRIGVRYRANGQSWEVFQTELNIAMPSCDGPAGRFVFRNHVSGGFGQPMELTEVSEIMLEDDVLGGQVILRLSRPAQLLSAPHFSISQSEAGFEKIMQAVTLILRWPMEAIAKGLSVDLEVVKRG